MNKKDQLFLFGGLLLLSFLVSKPIINKVRNTQTRSKYINAITAAEIRNGLPAGILDKMAETESSYRDDVISGKIKSNAGAVGILQIVPKWHPAVNPYDPFQSINYSAKYLKDLYIQTGDYKKALAAYNWGIGNLQKYGLEKAPLETKNYIKKILA